MSNPTPSQDSLYRDAIIDAAEHGWDDLLDKADQPTNPFAEELWLMEKKKAQQQSDDIIVNMDGGVGGSWEVKEPQKLPQIKLPEGQGIPVNAK